MKALSRLQTEALNLLKELITIPSFSGREDRTAEKLFQFLHDHGIKAHRKFNNVWARNRYFDPQKPTLLLNSHHDTVQVANGWQHDPFVPCVEKGKLFGLGSNDAGAPLVSLLAAFVYFYDQRTLSHNLIFAATAEEESSGAKGISSVLPELGRIDLAVVGEPTAMELAIAEKGLIVLNCRAHGTAGHAARNVGKNAIYKAIPDLQWFNTFRFPKESTLLGPIKMTVTVIRAGTLHNVIPDHCDFTVDIRTTDAYTNEEVLQTIRDHIQSEILKTSLRLRPSSIKENHPLVKAAKHLGIAVFGSPTLSDQSLIEASSVKIGPGMSERSHTADEFVYLDEVRKGIEIYIHLLENYLAESRSL